MIPPSVNSTHLPATFLAAIRRSGTNKNELCRYPLLHPWMPDPLQNNAWTCPVWNVSVPDQPSLSPIKVDRRIQAVSYKAIRLIAHSGRELNRIYTQNHCETGEMAAGTFQGVPCPILGASDLPWVAHKKSIPVPVLRPIGGIPAVHMHSIIALCGRTKHSPHHPPRQMTSTSNHGLWEALYDTRTASCA